MAPEEYEYRGLIAQSWDLLRGDTSGWKDRPFYKDVIQQSGEPALDVGCGTGRLLLDYLAEGIDIDGVDNSPEMLALCSENARRRDLEPTLYQQGMEALDLPRRYRSIIVPSSSFQLVTDPGAAAETMRRFFDHLEPGGALVMPFMILWTGQATEEIAAEEWKQVAERARPQDGAVVRRWTRSTYDLAQQLEHTEDRYDVLRDGEVVASEHHARSPATRWYTQEQAVDLYQGAGFAEICLLSGFSHQPASAEDTIYCVLGTRP
jgi:ubiquinone/menaquinone biosynthesis C-methylase UbiE